MIIILFLNLPEHNIVEVFDVKVLGKRLGCSLSQLLNLQLTNLLKCESVKVWNWKCESESVEVWKLKVSLSLATPQSSADQSDDILCLILAALYADSLG